MSGGGKRRELRVWGSHSRILGGEYGGGWSLVRGDRGAWVVGSPFVGDDREE